MDKDKILDMEIAEGIISNPSLEKEFIEQLLDHPHYWIWDKVIQNLEKLYYKL